MPATEAEINAEKAAKSRPDLLPATAVSILAVQSRVAGNVFGAYLCLLVFRKTLQKSHIEDAMGSVVELLGGFPTAILNGGLVMGYGFRKHGKCTWRVCGTEQADPQTHLASAERHLLEYMQDEDATEEGSKFPVLYHAFAQLCILYDLLVDPPQIPGVNDGKGMIAPRPEPPEEENADE